jgi:uncharacterized peroxidase-related enzyme
MPWFGYLGQEGGMGEIMAAAPDFWLPMAQFTDHVMRGESQLSIPEREMIAAFVSGLNACAFCHGSHLALADAYGIPAADIGAMVADLDTAPVPDRLRPLLHFVRKLTLTPTRMTPADAAAVFAMGWNEQALRDAILVCGLFSFYNRVVEGHGVEGHSRPGWGEPNRKALDALGYAGRLKTGYGKRD